MAERRHGVAELAEAALEVLVQEGVEDGVEAERWKREEREEMTEKN